MHPEPRLTWHGSRKRIRIIKCKFMQVEMHKIMKFKFYLLLKYFFVEMLLFVA